MRASNPNATSLPCRFWKLEEEFSRERKAWETGQKELIKLRSLVSEYHERPKRDQITPQKSGEGELEALKEEVSHYISLAEEATIKEASAQALASEFYTELEDMRSEMSASRDLKLDVDAMQPYSSDERDMSGVMQHEQLLQIQMATSLDLVYTTIVEWVSHSKRKALNLFHNA